MEKRDQNGNSVTALKEGYEKREMARIEIQTYLAAREFTVAQALEILETTKSSIIRNSICSAGTN